MINDRTNIYIGKEATVKEVLQKMDNTYRRLLIVIDNNNQYFNLVSIGDIQRYLIKNQDFNAPLTKVLRKNVTVGYSHESPEQIKAKILQYRSEFMPILNNDGTLDKVVFWEDLFSAKKNIQTGGLDLPVIIMAGGKGTRLRPITHIIPKPLIPIGEMPIMQLIIDQFRLAGCQSYFITTGYKSNMIRAYFEDTAEREYDITYINEIEPLGTAGSLSLIKDKIDTTFFVSNCDIIIEQDYSEIYKYHKNNKNELTAVAFVKDMKIPYGTFEVEKNGILKSLVEKPQFTFLINAGMYILEPHLLNQIPENKFFHITHLMEAILSRNGRVGIFPIPEGSWHDIGQWKEYQKTLNKYGYKWPQ